MSPKSHPAWNKGKAWPEEVKRKVSISTSGPYHHNWGKHLSEETKRKISIANTGKHQDRKGKTYQELYGDRAWGIIEKIKVSNRRKTVSMETREKIRRALLGNKHSPTWYLKMRGRKLSSEHIKKTMRRRIPTSLEEKFMEIADKHNLPYAYVGDGSLIIDGYNPDFINIDGRDILIEVYARLYKQLGNRQIGQWKNNRTNVFGQHNFKTIFFDETELTEENVLKILN